MNSLIIIRLSAESVFDIAQCCGRMFLLGFAGTIDDGTRNDTLFDNAYAGCNCGHMDWLNCYNYCQHVLLARFDWLYSSGYFDCYSCFSYTYKKAKWVVNYCFLYEKQPLQFFT